MTFTGGNDNLIVCNPVNQSMFPCNTARPMPCPVALKWLGLACAFEGVANNFNNKGVYLFKNVLVVFFPLTISGESFVLKTNHSCLFSLSRITGLLIRNSVSSCSRISISTTWLGYVVLIVLIKELPKLKLAAAF